LTRPVPRLAGNPRDGEPGVMIARIKTVSRNGRRLVADLFENRVAAAIENAIARRYLAWTRRFPRTPMAWHRSNLQGGISTDGMCPVPGRTLNHYNMR